uniref:Ig-like domain-containing protein n=1 Tax=Denticeps clupeoides TaxID=299321 RepID=A0AAY4C0X1_9TELE
IYRTGGCSYTPNLISADFTKQKNHLTGLRGGLNFDQTEVFWRYKGKTRVFRIAAGGGVASGDSQDMQFANRITYFPEEYSKGNFSILLSNLTRNDSGKYTCFSDLQSVVRGTVSLEQLRVKCLAQGHNGSKWDSNPGVLVHRRVCYPLGCYHPCRNACMNLS